MDNMTDSGAQTDKYLSKAHTVKITHDVTYGFGSVGYLADRSVSHYRPLLLDIYEPEGDEGGLRPALVLAFGGAFQRNSRKDDVTVEGTNRNTAIAEYCYEFARRGFVCFSIDYRLMGEAPDPGITPIWQSSWPPPNVERANHVRGLLGQPPCTPDMMIETTEAATDDMVQAITFVRSRANALRIDTSQIACGGFSAGATIAINAVYAEQAPASAVIAISGRMTLGFAKQYLSRVSKTPLLMIFGENDLPGTLEDFDFRNNYLDQLGLDHEIARVAGATHFYLRSSKLDGNSDMDVETMIATFLASRLAEGPAVSLSNND